MPSPSQQVPTVRVSTIFIGILAISMLCGMPWFLFGIIAASSYALKLFLRRLIPNSRPIRTIILISLSATCLLVVSTGTMSKYSQFKIQQKRQQELLETLNQRLSVKTIEAIQNDPLFKHQHLTDYVNYFDAPLLTKAVLKEISEILAIDCKRGESIRIFIPFKDSKYLFLWKTASWSYADVRPLESGLTEIGDYEIVSHMISQRAAYHTGFWDYLLGEW